MCVLKCVGIIFNHVQLMTKSPSSSPEINPQIDKEAMYHFTLHISGVEIRNDSNIQGYDADIFAVCMDFLSLLKSPHWYRWKSSNPGWDLINVIETDKNKLNYNSKHDICNTFLDGYFWGLKHLAHNIDDNGKTAVIVMDFDRKIREALRLALNACIENTKSPVVAKVSGDIGAQVGILLPANE